MSSRDTNPWSNFCDPHWELICRNKWHSGTWFLHMIDHKTRYFASSLIKSKKEVGDQIFSIWIKIFSKDISWQHDKFDNTEFQDFCENLNIKIKTTAKEGPLTNGMVEQHNGVIGESVFKITKKMDWTLSIALSWAVYAKNSLQNLYGFRPNQLVFGQNLNFSLCTKRQITSFRYNYWSCGTKPECNVLRKTSSHYFRS